MGSHRDDDRPTDDFGLFDDDGDGDDDRGHSGGDAENRSHDDDSGSSHVGTGHIETGHIDTGYTDASDTDQPESATGEMDLGELRDVLAGRAAPRPADQRPAGETGRAKEPPAKRRPKRRPVRSVLIAILVMAVIAGGVAAGVWWWWGSGPSEPTDWAGTGSQQTVVRVNPGDGLYNIGRTLVDDGIVADAQTFVDVALNDGRLGGLPPGYYHLHKHSSSLSAVDDLADPDNRLGQLRVIPGQTLADVTVVSTDGETSTKQGIMSAIVDACFPTDGSAECFSTDELWQVAETADPSELGVVGWAVDEVRKSSDPRRRLEGLILPGDYIVPPDSTAKQALSAIVGGAASKWNDLTIEHDHVSVLTLAEQQGVTPYQLVTIASLVQAEGIGDDMPKVARVIYNRLAIDMMLQFDSTVNYGLGRARIATSDSERLDADNVYSTYAHHGLPPTPIGAPGPNALQAAGNPADGDWLYFVAIDTNGNSCFSVTFAEHQACVDQARANGVFG